MTHKRATIEVTNRYYRIKYWNANNTEILTVDLNTRLDVQRFINAEGFNVKRIKSIRQIKEYKINE